jgi:hypothetical protein
MILARDVVPLQHARCLIVRWLPPISFVALVLPERGQRIRVFSRSEKAMAG